MNQHDRALREQFTLQADTFARMPEHSDPEAMELLAGLLRLTPAGHLLDVACGPGLVGCALAPRVARVTGVDVVPAMIEQARARGQSAGLAGVEWQVADSRALPFGPAMFDWAVSRYAFHHLEAPVETLREMVRVTRPGGRVAVVDATPPAPAAARYNGWERRRDPSHVRALTPEELADLGSGLFAGPPECARYRLDVGLSSLLAASFPDDAAGFAQELAEDIGVDALGVQGYRRDGQLRFRFPITLAVWTR